MKTIRYSFLAAMFALTVVCVLPHKALASKERPLVISKQTSVFGSFRTHRQGKGITAVWNLASADGVVGFSVQRTYEDPTDPYAYWEDAGSVPFNSTRSFTFTDSEVFPGTISYRIVALMTDGTTSVSDVSQVRIVSHK
ncbi:hypothetical protein [Flavisolibacter ginsenosidimutans]|uniref:Fibronectin type III domain-containing protein n=1 Tax=Flavisolibacter ginsenosidimutans TaxID=661481 RepID=A0A5B8UMD9_9BACT|nr:hypothetical protein [Flavisolibacter ginsenosidimutans]QEC57824.1 hypothetical protein FSB75_18585 [Flavisolibacter ginsenosidimutans]